MDLLGKSPQVSLIIISYYPNYYHYYSCYILDLNILFHENVIEYAIIILLFKSKILKQAAAKLS